jgi:hypothetical protein
MAWATHMFWALVLFALVIFEWVMAKLRSAWGRGETCRMSNAYSL